jgi:serine phosphatase RsbU (regulator of sigma subunit)
VIHHDDLVVLFTDGVSEARRPGGDILGSEAVYRLIAHWAHEGPATVVATCVDAARLHAGLRLPDDALIFALRRS